MFGYLGDYLLWWLIFFSLVVHTWCFFKFFPRRKDSRGGLVVGNLLVLACLLGAAGLVGESYFRFISVETDSFGLSYPARRWFALHTRLNSLNCRDKEWTRAKPGTIRRIAFVGDSFAYGWGVENPGDRFTERLQKMFNRSGVSFGSGNTGVQEGTVGAQRVEVMNVAKPGWGTGDQLQPVADMIDVYAADEIVLCYVPNDIEKLIPRRGDFNPLRPPEPEWINPTSSCLLSYLYYRVFVPRVGTVSGYHDWLIEEGFGNDFIWREHQQQLHEMAQLCRDRNVTFRVALLPFIRWGGEGYEAEKIHLMLRDFFEVNGVPVVDLLPTLAGRDAAGLVVNSHDAHPNELAHQLWAQEIWKGFYAPLESTPGGG